MHAVVKGPSAQATRRWQNVFLITQNHIKICPCLVQARTLGVQGARLDPNKIIQVPVSYLCGSGNNWCQPLKSTDSKAKNWKIPQIKIPWSMCSRYSSQIIKIVLVVLISGALSSEKHPKTYQLGLWFLWPLKGTTSILTHFRSPSPPRSAPKNKGLPPVKKKKNSDLPQSPPTSKI